MTHCVWDRAHAVTSVGPAPRGLLSSAVAAHFGHTDEVGGKGGHPGSRAVPPAADFSQLRVSAGLAPASPDPAVAASRPHHLRIRSGLPGPERPVPPPSIHRRAATSPGTVPRQRNNVHAKGKPVEAGADPQPWATHVGRDAADAVASRNALVVRTGSNEPSWSAERSPASQRLPVVTGFRVAAPGGTIPMSMRMHKPERSQTRVSASAWAVVASLSALVTFANVAPAAAASAAARATARAA